MDATEYPWSFYLRTNIQVSSFARINVNNYNI